MESLRTLTLNEAAKFLHIHTETLRAKAKSGAIPGIKVGKRWVFIQEDLANWLRQGYISPAQRTPRLSTEGGNLCRYTNVVTLGGSTSQPPVDKEYAALLKLKTAKQP